MAYTKCECKDGETVISAELLNAMQDALCAASQHAENNGNPHGLTAAKVGARPDTWTPTAAEVGARPDTWTPTAAEVGAVPESNTSDAYIIAATGRETWYRLAVTTAGNLRVDKSTDAGATWKTFTYAARTMNSGSASAPLITSSGRDGSVAIRNGAAATDGAGLWLYGNDHATNAGKFLLQMYDEENKKHIRLEGSPNGSLLWDGKELAKTETLTLTTAEQSGYTVSSISAYSRAGVVDVHINLTVATAASSWVTLATIPSGYRPPVNVYEDIPYFKASYDYDHIRLRVTPEGLIQVCNGTAGAAYAFHDTFVSA